MAKAKNKKEVEVQEVKSILSQHIEIRKEGFVKEFNEMLKVLTQKYGVMFNFILSFQKTGIIPTAEVIDARMPTNNPPVTAANEEVKE